MRCFIAVDVSEDVRAAVTAAQHDLKKAAAGADVRWTDPAAYHLTLKFLGEVAESRRDELRRALATAVAGHGPIALAAAGAGAFPTLRRPRVVWVGISQGMPELSALAGAVDRALEPLGFAREARAFSAHVTLGRVRSPKALEPLSRAIQAAERRDLGAWTGHEIVLYRSRLRPTGAVYEVLERVPLVARDR